MILQSLKHRPSFCISPNTTTRTSNSGFTPSMMLTSTALRSNGSSFPFVPLLIPGRAYTDQFLLSSMVVWARCKDKVDASTSWILSFAASLSAHHFLHYAPEDIPYGKKSTCYSEFIIYSACMHANYIIQGTLTKSSVSMAFLSFVSKIGNTLLDPEKAITPLQTLKRGLGTYWVKPYIQRIWLMSLVVG